MSASAGRVLLIFKGDYSALTTYTAMDCVFYNGSTYVCKQTSVGNLPTDTTYWQIQCQGQLAGNFYGTSSTASGTAEKVVTIPSDEHFILQQGDTIGVVFSNDNTASNPTLNVNGTGAKAIKYNGATVTSSELWTAGEAGIITMFQYDGTNWVWFAHGVDYNTTYTPEKLGIGIGTCSTAASTTAKEATLSGYELKENGVVAVKFDNAVPASATLNINSKGAKPIYYRGTALVTNVIKAGDTVTFFYNGTNYIVASIDRSEGHVVQDSDGTTMANRSKMKFDDADVTDDSVNDATIINVVRDTMTKSAFETAASLPDGIYPLSTPEALVMNADMVGYGSETVKDALDTISGQVEVKALSATPSSGITLDENDLTLMNGIVFGTIDISATSNFNTGSWTEVAQISNYSSSKTVMTMAWDSSNGAYFGIVAIETDGRIRVYPKISTKYCKAKF